MTDQKRDESRDIGIVWGDIEIGKNCTCHISPPCSDCVNARPQPVDVSRWEDCDVEERYVPHSALVAAEERADDAEYELKRLKSELRGVAANLDRQLHPDDDMMPRGKRIRLSMTGMLDHLEDLLK